MSPDLFISCHQLATCALVRDWQLAQLAIVPSVVAVMARHEPPPQPSDACGTQLPSCPERPCLTSWQSGLQGSQWAGDREPRCSWGRTSADTRPGVRPSARGGGRRSRGRKPAGGAAGPSHRVCRDGNDRVRRGLWVRPSPRCPAHLMAPGTAGRPATDPARCVLWRRSMFYGETSADALRPARAAILQSGPWRAPAQDRGSQREVPPS